VSPRRVRFTAAAQQQVERERDWWTANRDEVGLFASELEAAVRTVTILPGAGAPYPDAGVAGLRRIYVRKLTCHLYYTFSDQEVVVRAMWGARRRSGPSLRP
jgi:plasmid stabilization system protein ParE